MKERREKPEKAAIAKAKGQENSWCTVGTLISWGAGLTRITVRLGPGRWLETGSRVGLSALPRSLYITRGGAVESPGHNSDASFLASIRSGLIDGVPARITIKHPETPISQ